MATKEKDFTRCSDVDVAYYILSEKGEPVYYKDLVLEIIELRHKPVQSLSNTISEVYTLINMDSRFSYVGRNEDGKSMWGLSEWVPAEPKRSHSTAKTVKEAGAAKGKTRRTKAEKTEQGK